jgi:hypothetical protein
VTRASFFTASLLALTAFSAPTAGSQTRITETAATAGGCPAVRTRMLVHRFVRRYDDGDASAAARLWAPEPYFQWFSTGPPGARLGPAAYNRATLAAYLRTRVRKHERLRLTELHTGYDQERKIVNFAGKLVRSAADLPAGPAHEFKGAAACLAGKPTLIVWSM